MEKKFKVGKTFVLGFGFFGVSIIWALYNAYVPIFLKQGFHFSSFIIGIIMTIDNIFAILLLPYLGAMSDRTRTKLGRRRPYILAGAPFAALFFILIPYATLKQSVFLMMSTIILMNLAMAVFRTPVIALMPDIIPSKFRSQANGIINFMGGLGALFVYFGGKKLYDANIAYPFIVGGLVMLAASLIVVIFVNEDKPVLNESESENSAPISLKESFKALLDNLSDVIRGEKSLLFVLLAIFFWFIGYNALETFFTSYAKFYLHIKASTGALILGMFVLSFMVFSLFAGFIGAKKGRRKTIQSGLFIVTLIMISSLFVKNFMAFAILFFIGGFGWALVNVNSLPMVVDMTTLEKVGGYTGLYYFFSQAANIIAPPFAGFLIDLFGYPALLVFSSVFFILAFLMMSFVRRGEIIEDEEQYAASL